MPPDRNTRARGERRSTLLRLSLVTLSPFVSRALPSPGSTHSSRPTLSTSPSPVPFFARGGATTANGTITHALTPPRMAFKTIGSSPPFPTACHTIVRVSMQCQSPMSMTASPYTAPSAPSSPGPCRAAPPNKMRKPSHSCEEAEEVEEEDDEEEEEEKEEGDGITRAAHEEGMKNIVVWHLGSGGGNDSGAATVDHVMTHLPCPPPPRPTPPPSSPSPPN